jgi:hypothetical protein
MSEYSPNTAPPQVRVLEISSFCYENPLVIKCLKAFSG